jgi:hypothetical protein
MQASKPPGIIEVAQMKEIRRKKREQVWLLDSDGIIARAKALLSSMEDASGAA